MYYVGTTIYHNKTNDNLNHLDNALSGKIEYYDVRNELYNQTQAVMLVYDVTNRPSFQSLEAWNRECARCSADTPLVTVVVANKVGGCLSGCGEGNIHTYTRGGLNDLRVDTMITKWEFRKSERTHHPLPT